MTDRPAGWKNMDDFAPGIATNRLPASDVLAGSELKLAFDDGTATTLRFTSGDEVRVDGGSVRGYEAIAVRDDLIFLGLAPEGKRLTVIVLHQGHALRVVSTIADEPTPGRPRVSQTFTPGTVDGSDTTAGKPGAIDGSDTIGGEPWTVDGVGGEKPAPTRELIGRRALYRYSPEHLYEHVYLSSERYAWQCLVGAQRGHGDVDLATAWKIAEDVYVFTFREFRIPVAATWLYDWAALRTVGTFFGLSGDGEINTDPGGAYIEPLDRATYPNEEPI